MINNDKYYPPYNIILCSFQGISSLEAPLYKPKQQKFSGAVYFLFSLFILWWVSLSNFS